MSDPDSLTIALEMWFDKPLSDIPDSIRQRIEKDMFPLPWDDLNPEQRRIIALQLDCQRDPITKKGLQYGSDFFWKTEASKKKIAEWGKIIAPTASDLAHKESKLEVLHDEHHRMSQQERQPQLTQISERPRSASSLTANNAQISENYIAYPKALKFLADRWGATPEELAAWVFIGPEQGGLSAYTNANELDPPLKFSYGYYIGVEDYIAPLMACWFREEEITNFQPTERFITGKALMERWGQHFGIQPAAFIRAKIAESRLIDMHPIFGITQGSFPEWEDFPVLESGLFYMSHITAIEEIDGITPCLNQIKTNHSNINHAAEKPWWTPDPSDPSVSLQPFHINTQIHDRYP